MPSYVPYHKTNASTDEPLECVLVRSDQEPVVVKSDVEPAEAVEEVLQMDPNHPARPVGESNSYDGIIKTHVSPEQL